MKFYDLSKRDQDALAAMRSATREKPILPRAYLFRRDAADHLVRIGLADFRGFDGNYHGGYWQTEKGREVYNECVAENIKSVASHDLKPAIRLVG